MTREGVRRVGTRRPGGGTAGCAPPRGKGIGTGESAVPRAWKVTGGGGGGSPGADELGRECRAREPACGDPEPGEPGRRPWEAVRSRRLRPDRLQARLAGLKGERDPAARATALTWSAPPSLVQGGTRELPYPNESLGRVGNAPGNSRPPPLPPGRCSAARPLPPGAPPSARWPPGAGLLRVGPVGSRFSRIRSLPAARCSGHRSKGSRDGLAELP